MSHPPADAMPTPRLFLGSDVRVVVAVLVFLAIAPFVLYPIFVMKALCFALFAAAFNLVLGFGGLLSIGHAAFFGMAAYAAGYAMKAWGVSPEIGILIGTAVGGGLGLLFGSLAIRRQGIYFAMITLALAQLLYFFALRAPFTGGENGMQAIPRGRLLGLVDLDSMPAMYLFVVAVFLLGNVVILRAIGSPFGRILVAAGSNEPRAISLGYDAARFKLTAFVLSAALSGTAGALKALVFELASLSDVHWFVSGEVILMTLVGGVGTLLGPFVGAFVVVGLQDHLTFVGDWMMTIEGAIFMACVVVFRKGIVGTLADALDRRTKTR